MLVLPTQWVSRSLTFLGDSGQCIYGFIYDTVETCSCGFYLTNFHHVWVQELGKKGIKTAASSIGLEDLSDGDLVHLLRGLNEDVRSNITFERKDNHIIAATNGQPQWKFSLIKQDDARTVRFLAKLNYQQFANRNFLKYQIDNLKDIIAVKDQYARFLATNFKQSHGMELINNYKRINSSDLESIERFNALRWEEKSAIDYRSLRSRKRGSNEDELKKDISMGVEEPWRFANLFYLNVTEEQEELSPVKFEFDELQSTPEMQSQSFQFESQPTLDLSFVEPSPTKFKQPAASQSMSLSSKEASLSPRKRRKIGSLSKK
ncbi:hypothetical protein Cantr_01713 [Candida viswanathii]|uniref:Uncharacterized protein n=1 Tax=Candida viswanathii TaxID=5486 RepID=A0A367YJL8_9ASCO|nr:hypothetical protein Cantr_01713 [Candida viswanathii]